MPYEYSVNLLIEWTNYPLKYWSIVAFKNCAWMIQYARQFSFLQLDRTRKLSVSLFVNDFNAHWACRSTNHMSYGLQRNMLRMGMNKLVTGATKTYGWENLSEHVNNMGGGGNRKIIISLFDFSNFVYLFGRNFPNVFLHDVRWFSNGLSCKKFPQLFQLTNPGVGLPFSRPQTCCQNGEPENHLKVVDHTRLS